jgi:fumarate reductase subunit D
VLLTGLFLVALAAPVLAHPVTQGVPSSDLPTADVVVAAPAAVTAPVPEPAVIPGWVFAAALILAVTAACRRPRRALAVALVLLLTIFAFENALHSVHHGFDASQYDECTIAAASAHVSAVSVDGVVETAVILAVGASTADVVPSLRPSRFLGRDQGRAPPAPSV